MCGICGIAYRDGARPVEEGMLARMTRTLVHRGPDDEGFFRAPGVGLGVRRLAIMDPQGGQQPIANESGDVVVVCNGEIYNDPELRAELEARGHRFRTRSDVESIVHLYEEMGDACVERLRGMFGLAVWDGPRRRLLLARDRLGIKPLEWAEGEWGIAFGSESKAILASGLVRAELSPEAVDDTFALGFVLAPQSSFRGMHRLPPGHLVAFENGRAAVRRYWTPPVPGDGRPARTSRAALAGELRERLSASVRSHLRSDVPVGSYLSGGLDSSAVVALMERNGVPRPVAYTISFVDSDLDEIRRTRTLESYPGHSIERRLVKSDARDLGRIAFGIWHAEHPCAVSFGVPHLRLAESASRSFKTVLTGEGADETHYGYWWYGSEPVARRLSALPRFLRMRMLQRAHRMGWYWPWVAQALLTSRGEGLHRFSRVAGPPGRHDYHGLLDRDFAAGMVPAPDRWPRTPPEVAALHPVEQFQYWDSTTRLADFILHRVDRLAMAHSLEVRVPFLDHELYAWSVRMIPWRWNAYVMEKTVLRRALRGVLPEEIRKRRKHPLHAPYEEWLRRPLPEYVEELLSERSLKDKGIFHAPTVRTALERHRAGTEEHGLQLLAVVSYQVWDEIFVRGRSPSEFSVA